MLATVGAGAVATVGTTQVTTANKHGYGAGGYGEGDYGGSTDDTTDSPTLSNTVRIEGTGPTAEYQFTVNETLEKNGEIGSINDSDTIDGTTATGVVYGGNDAYDYESEITDFSLSGDANVYVNGEQVDPSTLGSSNDDTTKSLAVTTVDVTGVDTSSAILTGSLTELQGYDSATVQFEWGQSSSGLPNKTPEQSLGQPGEFQSEITGLNSDTQYEFRAVVNVPVEASSDTISFRTGAEDNTATSPVIDQFNIENNSTSVWSRYDVDWAVSHEDADLDTVVTELRYKGSTVVAESTSIFGESESFSHTLRVRGDVDEVQLSVNDTKNKVVSETKDA